MQIFDNPYKKTETWSVNGAFILWGVGSVSNNKLPLLCNSVQITFSRTINAYFPINTDSSGEMKKINVMGQTNGNLTLRTIMGPDANDMKAFIEAVSKGCKKDSDQVVMSIQPYAKSGCANSNNNVKYTLYGVELARMDVSIDSSQGLPIVNQPLVFLFTDMELL